MKLKKYLTFEGRISRSEYLFFPLFLGFQLLPFKFIAELANNIIISILYFSISILVYIIQVCITVQRLHDIERSGFHYFLLWVPIYNIYLGILLLFIKGTDGPNEYGEDPLAIVYE